MFFLKPTSLADFPVSVPETASGARPAAPCCPFGGLARVRLAGNGGAGGGAAGFRTAGGGPGALCRPLRQVPCGGAGARLLCCGVGDDHAGYGGADQIVSPGNRRGDRLRGLRAAIRRPLKKEGAGAITFRGGGARFAEGQSYPS